MDKKTLSFLAVMIVLMMLLVVIVGAMSGGLPTAVKNQYKAEKTKLDNARKLLTTQKNSLESLRNDFSDYYALANSREELSGKYDAAEKLLTEADNLFKNSAEKLYDKNKKDDAAKLSADLSSINRNSTEAAVVLANLEKRLNVLRDYVTNPQKYEKSGQEDYDSIKNKSFAELSAKVTQAQTDWPEKKDDLAGRFTSIQEYMNTADSFYRAYQAGLDSNPVNYYQVGSNATYLSDTKNTMTTMSDELSKLIDELYVSYDKKLIDMDIREGLDVEFYHQYQVLMVDKDDKSSQTEPWQKITEAEYKANENNLGMVIESKPKGKYASEAVKKPIPPGYNYVGNTRYGSWQTDQYGHRHWNYHSHYAFLPLFFYGSSWRSQPIYYNDWNNYRTYSSYGRPYYGQSTTGSQLYGSQGSYTRTSYKNSKYYSSGGFSNTQYKKSGGTYRGSRYTSSSRSSSSSSSSSYRGSSSSRSRSSGGK